MRDGRFEPDCSKNTHSEREDGPTDPELDAIGLCDGDADSGEDDCGTEGE